MSKQAVVIGAGGFGREVMDWFLAWAGRQNDDKPEWTFAGFLDDGRPDEARLGRLGAKHLGPLSMLRAMPDVAFYIGVGDPSTRRRIAAEAEALGGTAGPPIIHPTAVVGSDVQIGAGSIICPLVSMTTNIRVGVHVHLDRKTTVGHDTVIGDFVSVNPGATISGDVHLDHGVMIGTNAAINQGLSIGAGSVLGAGAAAVRDIPAGVVAVGVPAKPRA